LQNFEFFLFSLIQCYVGIFSYNGEVSCTVNLDKQVKADPQLLANLFAKSFEDIYKEVFPNGAPQPESPVKATTPPMGVVVADQQPVDVTAK